MDSKKKKILIIDDHEEIRDLVDRIFRGTEFDVLKAPGGREGIQIAKKMKPDVILLDIMMPNFDGFMTSSVLKRNLGTKDIPIIFMTAKNTKEDIAAALKAGGADYIVKPFAPSDLLKRLKKMVESQEIKHTYKSIEEKKKSTPKESSAEEQRSISQAFSRNNFSKHGGIMVYSTTLDSIIMDNCYIFRVAFANITSDGFFKVILNTSKIHTIDGAGLALLILVNESLRSYGGELRITFPSNKVNNRFSFVKLNDLFRAYSGVQVAVDSFHELDTHSEETLDSENLNVCLSCTFVNAPDLRYCINCGTNLVAGKEEKILKTLRHSISQNIISEAGTNDIQKINWNINIKAEEDKIPSEFNVELLTDDLTIAYKSVCVDSQDFTKNEQIAIEAPLLKGNMFPVQDGMSVRLMNPLIGLHSIFETQISAVDIKRKIIYVHYTEDAKALHSQKNFSIVPQFPIPARFLIPSLDHSYEIMQGKILEMSRIRMIVFSEENIPEDQCLAVNFNLPDGQEITSPLVFAQKRKEKFMFDIEFVVIDEKERSKIVHYMYKRQIELANPGR